MTDPVSLKYRAFISYAHADEKQALWLHKALEGFRIDKDLIGRETALGPVPKTLRPIFRDRDDFSGGNTLASATVAALDASAALIVLCSPVAATRSAVNEEVRLFRWRHPGRPVIPVIIGMVSDPPGLTPGTNGAMVSDPEGLTPIARSFPPALRFEVTADGTVTDKPITILGPDLREAGDGRELGLSKLVASLIGVPVDDVRKRQAIAEARRVRIVSGVATGFAVLALLAGFLFYQNRQQATVHEAREKERVVREVERDKQMAEMRGLVQSLLSISSAQAASGSEAAVGHAVTDAAKGAAAGDQRLKQALELLKAGKPAEAEPLFRAVADEKGAKVQQDKAETAAAYRNLGAIAGLGDPKRAREAYARALEFDPDDIESLYWHGRLHNDAGDLNTAEPSLQHLLDIATKRSDARGVFRAHLELGYLKKDRGNLTQAREHQQTAVSVANREQSASPAEPEWQLELARGHVGIGDVLIEQGNLPDALKSFQSSLDIRERLAKADPNNAGWQRDVALSLGRVAMVDVQLGEATRALGAFLRGRAIIALLKEKSPDNATLPKDPASFDAQIAALEGR